MKPSSSPLLRTRPWGKRPRWSAEQHWMISNEMSPAAKAHCASTQLYTPVLLKMNTIVCKINAVNRLRKIILASGNGPPRTFQQTHVFPEVLQRLALHQQIISIFTSSLKINTNSLGTTPAEWTWIQTNTYLRFSERWFSTSLQHRGLYSSKCQLWIAPIDYNWTMHCELLPLLQSAFFARYLQLLFLQQLFTF